MKRILVAVDHSEPSLRAVDYAAELARAFGADMVLLTVIPHVAGSDPGLEAYLRTEQIHESPDLATIEIAHGRLAEIRERAIAKGARTVETEVGVGSAAEEILSVAQLGTIDAIVLGCRGHGPLAGLMLGSVSQRVVGLAPCPVTVLR